VIGTEALAVLRLDLHDAALTADGVALTVRVPAWVRLQEEK
jgi:hypothetical protein